MRSDDEQVEAHLDRHRRRLEDHEAALAATRDQLAGGAEPRGQVGTDTEAVEVVGTVALGRGTHVGSAESWWTATLATDSTGRKAKL